MKTALALLPTALLLTSTAYAVPPTCDALLPQMQEVITAVKSGQPATRDQNETWSAWNTFCKEAVWQRELARQTAAVPPQPPPDPVLERQPIVPVYKPGFWSKVVSFMADAHEYGPRFIYTRCQRLRSGTYCTTTGPR